MSHDIHDGSLLPSHSLLLHPPQVPRSTALPVPRGTLADSLWSCLPRQQVCLQGQRYQSDSVSSVAGLSGDHKCPDAEHSCFPRIGEAPIPGKAELWTSFLFGHVGAQSSYNGPTEAG